MKGPIKHQEGTKQAPSRRGQSRGQSHSQSGSQSRDGLTTIDKNLPFFIALKYFQLKMEPFIRH